MDDVHVYKFRLPQLEEDSDVGGWHAYDDLREMINDANSWLENITHSDWEEGTIMEIAVETMTQEEWEALESAE